MDYDESIPRTLDEKRDDIIEYWLQVKPYKDFHRLLDCELRSRFGGCEYDDLYSPFFERLIILKPYNELGDFVVGIIKNKNDEYEVIYAVSLSREEE